jgi:phosphopantothenoylcysteine decarboxylase/phosphopantothenate--cysteine ligase
MSTSKILFQLSCSIACFKACALISMLVKAGHEVEVVATRSALKFVGEATLEGLTGRRVHTDTFESGAYMQHIHLMRWADAAILCPASANTLNKFAAGVGDDLVTTLFLAHDFKKPYLVAPAMNQTMYAHPATQASLKQLSTWGLQVLNTGTGALACGENGEGRMLEPEQIFEALTAALKNLSPVTSPVPRILITSGGTSEPIDGVRSITNTSTGRTGAELAETLAHQGFDVTLLHAESAVTPPNHAHISMKSFASFASLQTLLDETLTNEKFDAVIHLAAVADYSLAEVVSNGAVTKAPINGKLDSGEELVLKLKRNPKLIDTIKAKAPNAKVIAFKLTRTLSTDERKAAVEQLAKHANADFIVHNDLEEITAHQHPFTIYQANVPIKTTSGARNLAHSLAGLIEGVEL